MSRKGQVFKKRPVSDSHYKEKVFGKFINKLMWDGKKSAAENIFFKALDDIQQKKNDDPIKIFKQALENAKPVLEVRSRRIGGANYQVPVEVRAERKASLAIRWLVESARKRGEKTMMQRLSGELLEAFENKGGAIKKKDEVHRMAEANRAFAHYRW